MTRRFPFEAREMRSNPRRVKWRGICAGLVVTFGVILSWALISLPTKVPKPRDGEPQSAKPIPATRPHMTKGQDERHGSTEKGEEIPYWKRETTNGLTHLQIMKWEIAHRPPATITNDSSRTERKPVYAIFDTHVDNDLAALLTTESGEGLVGDPGYERWFTKAFLKSIETPIIVTRNDTPEQAQLKRDVTALKLELKQRYDAGEDIAETVRQARENLQELARSKEQIERAVREILHADATLSDHDIDDLIDAANRMLGEKGIAPMELGPIARRRLMRQAQHLRGETR